MLRQLAAAVAVLLTFCATANAADLWSGRPGYPGGQDWNGFYVGANVGGAVANAHADFNAAGVPTPSVDNNLRGTLGGVQVGYNRQVGRVVYGAEADFQLGKLRGSLDAPCPAGLCVLPLSASYAQSIPWFGTARGRLGYASDGWLIYATGGFAFAQLHTEASAAAPGASLTFSDTVRRYGWTMGGGIEVALARCWSAKLEYLYVDLGSSDLNWTLPALPAINGDSRLTVNTVRTG